MRLAAKLLAAACVTALASPAFADKTYDVDLVVVGAGLAGLSAATTAQQGGAKTVVLEKLPTIGGAGNYPEGSFAIGTRLQKKLGVTTTADQVFGHIVEFYHWRINASLVRSIIDHSGEAIDWLDDIGVPFDGIKPAYGFPPKPSLGVQHKYKGHGAAAIKVMAQKFKEAGGVLLTETPAKELLTDASGAVTGVVAQGDGETITVKAKAVVLATGGFTNNQEMLKKYVPDLTAPGMERVLLRGPVPDGRTGDGINMAIKLDAELETMNTVAGNSPYIPYEPAILQFQGPDYLRHARTALSQPFLWVNRRGERFYNESNGSSWNDNHNAITKQGGYMFQIFDEGMKQRLINEGPLTPFNAIVVPGQKLTGLEEGITFGEKNGFAWRADTIDELATKLGMKPATLRKTMETINKYADLKRDPEFGRAPDHLVKFNLQKGPYYALKGVRTYFQTLGGVKVTSDMQAINKKNEVIPNLYVAGNDIGGLHDTSYDLVVQGTTSGFAVTTGRMAAHHALATLVKK